MARKKKNEINEFVELFSRLPWWIGVVCAVISYPLLHHYAIQLAATPEPGFNMGVVIFGSMFRSLANIGQYIVPGVCLSGAITSAVKGRQRRKLLAETQAASDQKEAINSLTWQDFERLVGEAYRQQGFTVNETAAGPDGGVDLEMRKDTELFLVQCKQWRATKVGVAIVRELYGVMAARGAVGGLCGHFRYLYQRCQGQNIELVDGQALSKLIGAGVEPAQREEVEPTPEPSQSAKDSLPDLRQ